MFASEQEVRSLHLFSSQSYEKSQAAAERFALRQARLERKAARGRSVESAQPVRSRSAIAPA